MFKVNTQEQNIFFTSDLHFGHSNIIKYCERPFKDADEMNEILIKNWNSVVQPNDIVFNLGDFCWGSSGKWHEFTSRLQGRHFLILGNHDEEHNWREGYFKLFEEVTSQMCIQVDKQLIYLTHFPLLCWSGCMDTHHVNWNLHGHVHTSKFKNLGKDFEMIKSNLPTSYDVGVDLNNFKPVNFFEVKEKINFQIEHNVNSTYWINHEL